jgi:bacterioferritin-associated ferredoxin
MFRPRSAGLSAPSMYACICKGITEADVRGAGRAGIMAPGQLVAVFGLDDEGCCGRCAVDVQAFVELACDGLSQVSQDCKAFTVDLAS